MVLAVNDKTMIKIAGVIDRSLAVADTFYTLRSATSEGINDQCHDDPQGDPKS